MCGFAIEAQRRTHCTLIEPALWLISRWKSGAAGFAGRCTATALSRDGKNVIQPGQRPVKTYNIRTLNRTVVIVKRTDSGDLAIKTPQLFGE